MKLLSLATVVLSLVLSSLPLASQPQTAQPIGPVRPEVHDLQLSLDYRNVDVVTLLRKISVEGNLNIIVSGEISDTIDRISLKDVTPEAALEQAVKLADLDLKIEDKTYLISPRTQVVPQAANSGIISQLLFQDVNASALLKILGDQGKIKITIDDMPQKLAFVRLTNESYPSAIEKVAEAAKLVWRKEGNGYVITKPKGI